MLKFFAENFLQKLQQPTLVARTGGEEFAALYKNVAVSDVIAELEQLRSTYVQAFDEQIDIPLCTFSVGIASTAALSSSRHLLKQADMALYKAKDSGRNQIHVFAL